MTLETREPRRKRARFARASSLGVLALLFAASIAGPAAADEPTYRQARHTSSPVAALRQTSPGSDSERQSFPREPRFVPSTAASSRTMTLPAATLHAQPVLAAPDGSAVALMTRLDAVPEPGFLLVLGSAFVFLARRLRRRTADDPVSPAH